MADVSVTENTVRLLSKRAAWYRDGCQDLEDRADYYASGDLARDAAGDLETALSEIRVLEMVVAKFRDPAAAARLVGSPEEPKHEGRRCYAHICGGNGHPDCPACQQQEQEQRNGTGMDLPALREADRNVQPHADSRRESATTAEDRPDDNGNEHEVAPGDGRAARLQTDELEAIKARLVKRREPMKGRCQRCGAEQEIPRFVPMAHSMAFDCSQCSSCHEPLTVTFTINSDEPSADEDIESLLAALTP